jgi:hypothetical protein
MLFLISNLGDDKMMLTKRDLGKLTALRYLIEEKGHVTKKELACYCNISMSTLKRYIESINNDLHEYKEFVNLSIQDIDTSYAIKNPTPFNEYYVIKKIQFLYYSKSIYFQLIRDILLGTVTHLSELVDKLYVSYTYIYKLLLEINSFIVPLGIKIHYSKQSDRVYMSGSKKDIQLFRIYFFWSTYQGVEWPFTHTTPDELYAYFRESELKEFSSLSSSKEEKYLYSLAVSTLEANDDEKDLQLSKEFKEILMIFQKTNDCSLPLCRKQSTENKRDEASIEEEQLYFNFICRIFGSANDSENVQYMIGEYLTSLENEVIHYCKLLVDSFLSVFSEKYTIEFPQLIKNRLLYTFSLYFVNTFYVQFKPATFQQLFHINVDAKVTESVIFIEAKTFFDTFLKENPLPEEICLSDVHLHLAYGLIHTLLSEIKAPSLAVYIQFSKNMFGQSYIQTQLYNTYGRENIHIASDIDQADIIISDFFENRYKERNYFYLDNLHDNKLWQNLNEFINYHRLKINSN